jgi:putative transposase
MKTLHKRKKNRLVNYDYSHNGAYFVTICAKDREVLFGKIVGAATCRPFCLELSETGQIIQTAIENIQNIYPDVLVDDCIIMPNHIHMILIIGHNGRQVAAPTLSLIVGNLKRYVSINAGFSPWQKSFHDHIIRNNSEYIRIKEYIENNPRNWESDCFYPG